MARRRNRKKTTDEDMSADESPSSAGKDLSQKQARLLSPVALPKARRPYTVNDPYRAPPIYFRQIVPWAAFRGGFRVAGAGPTHDSGLEGVLGMDEEGIDGTDALACTVNESAAYAAAIAGSWEAATPIALDFQARVWPYYDRLFRATVKTATTPVTFNIFTSYIALCTTLQSRILDLVNMIKLRDGIGIRDWDDMSGAFGSSFGLFNKTFERRVEKAIEIASQFPMIAGFANETRRMKSMFIPVGGEGTVCVPIEDMVANNASTLIPNNNWRDDIINGIERILSELRGDYAEELAAMKRHMPYTLGDINAFVPLPLTVDPFKSDGVINSDLKVLNVAGNNGDPADVNTIYINEEAAAVGFLPDTYTEDSSLAAPHNALHSVLPGGLTTLSLMSGSLWVSDNDAIDKEFALVTPHQVGHAWVPSFAPALNGINFTPFTADTIGAANYGFVQALSQQTWVTSGERIYSPYSEPVTPDLEAIVEGSLEFLHMSCDLDVVGSIDYLSKTSSASVVHPAVAKVRGD